MDWQPKRIIEEHYARAVQRLMNAFNEMLPYLNIQTPEDLVIVFQHYANTPEFQELASSAAYRMVTETLAASERTWREAAMKSSQGKLIFESLEKQNRGPIGILARHLIRENAELISTFSLRVSKEINSFANREYLAGRRSESVARSLVEQFPTMSRHRIDLIARTETSKASTALTQARAENFGWKWYIWRTSKDARVRRSHRLMDTVLCRWVDNPAPEILAGERGYGHYAPGNIFNCRCYPEVLLSLDQIQWPAKVYMLGQIKRMTRFAFENIHQRLAA